MRIPRHVPVEIRSTVGPPHWATLAETVFGGIDNGMGFSERIIGASCHRHRPPGCHQRRDQGSSLIFTEIRIGAPPEATADDDVAAIRRH